MNHEDSPEPGPDPLADDRYREARARYPEAAISRKAGFILVHLDRPSQETVRERTAAFDPDTWFDKDCPICQIQRYTRIYLFDDFPEDDESEEWIVFD